MPWVGGRKSLTELGRDRWGRGKRGEKERMGGEEVESMSRENHLEDMEHNEGYFKRL